MPFEAWILLVKLNHPFHAGATPCVEALVLIAYAKQEIFRRGEHLHQEFLGRLDVLILVDKDSCESILPVTAGVSVSLQKSESSEDEVIEIVLILLLETLLVQLVEVCECPLCRARRDLCVLIDGEHPAEL